MKAFLLTAGLGTRLRPLTDSTPKCLLPVAGRPLIDYWFELFAHYGIDEVLINLHHLPEQLEGFLGGKRFPRRIVTCYEPELLGSAGTVWANRGFVAGEPYFFIFYGDNLTNVRVDRWVEYHLAHGGDLTLMLYKTDKPHMKGIVELDKDGKVVSFVEKPSNPTSNLASAGMYIASPGIFDVFPKEFQPPLDMAFDVLPKLVGRMWGMISDDVILDIGMPEDYRLAQEIAVQIQLGDP
jgi:mannose-1-phosphate guanylyltransferase